MLYFSLPLDQLQYGQLVSPFAHYCYNLVQEFVSRTGIPPHEFTVEMRNPNPVDAESFQFNMVLGRSFQIILDNSVSTNEAVRYLLDNEDPDTGRVLWHATLISGISGPLRQPDQREVQTLFQILLRLIEERGYRMVGDKDSPLYITMIPTPIMLRAVSLNSNLRLAGERIPLAKG